jgi:guanylate kinase|tara:strand:+ start:194 stop:823 length:630 start_codon:yes stop_codon:yes gene_type:complete
MQSNGIIFILSAPSGAGKTTVCKLLKQKLPNLKFSISHTSREPRAGEVEGTDYHFITQKEFEKKIKDGEFLEWAKVFKNYYGTASESVDQHLIKGEDVLIELDVQGAQSLRNINYKAVFIFMMPPSLKELEARLNKRDTEPADKIQDRMKVSKKEIQQSMLYDYILTNIEKEETTNNLQSIITAEQLRKERHQPSSADIKTLIDNGEIN